MKRDALGLHLIKSGAAANRLMDRVRAQLRAADALLTVERDVAEPECVARLRREAESLLGQARYEEAEEAFLTSLEAGLADDHFPWQAAINLVNCQRFLGRLEDAEATAAQLQEMFAEQQEHPAQYLLATQRGAIAADRYAETADDADADDALTWARTAYDWQLTHRGAADGLRAYNLVVALLRANRRDEATAIHARHRDEADFTTWCEQGDQAERILAELGG